MGADEHLENLSEIEKLRAENERLKARLAERPVPYHVVTYGGYVPRTKPSKAWAVLGLLTIMGLSFLLIYVGILMFVAGIVAVFIGGFLARRAGAGALVGFFGIFLPLFLLGLLFLLMIPTSIGGLGLGTIFVGLVGIVLMITGVILGLIGAAIGAIAGAISSKVWKYKSFTPEPPQS